LKDRDILFAEEYLVDLNATAAALRAGFAPATARNAAEWIKEGAPKKPALRQLVDKKMAERSRRTGITADRVLNELAVVAFANAQDIIDPETAGVLPDATRTDRAAIKTIKIKRGDTSETQVELYDKVRALELIGKHLGMFTDNVQVQGGVPVVIDDVGE